MGQLYEVEVQDWTDVRAASLRTSGVYLRHSTPFGSTGHVPFAPSCYQTGRRGRSSPQRGRGNRQPLLFPIIPMLGEQHAGRLLSRSVTTVLNSLLIAWAGPTTMQQRRERAQVQEGLGAFDRPFELVV